jgi:PilZ domain
MEKPTGLPVPPLRSWRGASKLEIESPSVVTRFQPIDDPRRHPRFKMVTDIKVYSRNCGLLKGRTADISESGLAAMLTLEVPVGEMVELEFTLMSKAVTILAMVRQKNAFRYGFEFVNSNATNEVVRIACRQLAIENSLMSPTGSKE